MDYMDYQGYLLAAHPRRRDPAARRGVIFVASYSDYGSLGLMINKQIVDSITIQTVMENMGIDSDLDGPVYWGGASASNRISVIHSLDWSSSNTSRITADLGVSNDISVLSALAEDHGPQYYRVIAGHTKWPAGELDGEISGEAPWSVDDIWSWCPASTELIFGYTGLDQWHQVISTSASYQVAEWFA